MVSHCLFNRVIRQSIGNNPNGHNSRMGVFDWLIGHDCEGWSFSRRFQLEYVGMSLRGLVETVPIGYVLYLYGLGMDFMWR